MHLLHVTFSTVMTKTLRSSSTFSVCAPSEQGPSHILIFLSSTYNSTQHIVGAQEMLNE